MVKMVLQKFNAATPRGRKKYNHCLYCKIKLRTRIEETSQEDGKTKNFIT